MKIFYFTTTGNSLAVARAIGGELFSIPALPAGGPERYDDAEAIGVVCPVYFGALPAPVAEFLDRVELSAPYRFLVFTCGNTPAFAVRAGGKWDYVRSIRMVDNYFPMFDVAKQVRDLPRKRVGVHLAGIVDDIRERRQYVESPTLYGRVAGWWMRMFPLSPRAYRNFHIDSAKCNGCATCVRLCPVGNIVMADGRPEIGARCLTCGACYHNCPSGAIRYRGEKSRVQYRHEGVTLADIVGGMKRE